MEACVMGARVQGLNSEKASLFWEKESPTGVACGHDGG